MSGLLCTGPDCPICRLGGWAPPATTSRLGLLWERWGQEIKDWGILVLLMAVIWTPVVLVAVGVIR